MWEEGVVVVVVVDLLLLLSLLAATVVSLLLTGSAALADCSADGNGTSRRSRRHGQGGGEGAVIRILLNPGIRLKS
jgi:hypothetical protein